MDCLRGDPSLLQRQFGESESSLLWRRRVRRTAAKTGRHVVLWLRSDARDKRKHCALSPIDGDVITESQRTRFVRKNQGFVEIFRASSSKVCNASDECRLSRYNIEILKELEN